MEATTFDDTMNGRGTARPLHGAVGVPSDRQAEKSSSRMLEELSRTFRPLVVSSRPTNTKRAIDSVQPVWRYGWLQPISPLRRSSAALIRNVTIELILPLWPWSCALLSFEVSIRALLAGSVAIAA